MTDEPAGIPASATTLRAFWAQLPREGRWLLSTVAVQLFGRGLTLPFTVIYLHEVRGIGLDVAGSLMAWVFAVGVLVTTPGGAAVDKYGARLVTLVACGVNMVGVAILAVATSVPLAVLATTLMGISGVTWPAFNSMVSAIVSGPLRQQYFGVNFALVNLGIGLGGVVSGIFVDVHRPATFTTIYLWDAASMLVPIALLLGPLRHVHARAEKPADAVVVPATYLRIVRQPAMAWLLLLTFIGTFVGYGQMEAGFPAFARQASQVSTRTVGWAFAANTAVIVLAQFLVLRRIQGHRRTRVLMVMSLIWAASWTVLGLTGLVAATLTAAFGVVLFHVMFGSGETLFQPTLPAITNDLAPDHLRGRYNALSATFFQAGGIAGPVVAGVLLRHGLDEAFIGLVVAGCLAMIAVARALERRVPPAANGVTGPVGTAIPEVDPVHAAHPAIEVT
jgi:MFS family permease